MRLPPAVIYNCNYYTKVFIADNKHSLVFDSCGLDKNYCKRRKDIIVWDRIEDNCPYERLLTTPMVVVQAQNINVLNIFTTLPPRR
jgi:hypothetical protein